MDKARRSWIAALPLVAAALLAGCGGGGDQEVTPEGEASSVWLGTTSSQRELTALILSDGNHYLIYSGERDPGTVGGFVQGTRTLAGSDFVSDDAIDFHLEPLASGLAPAPAPAPVAATLVPRFLFEGTIWPGTAAAVDLDAVPDQAADKDATLAALAGSYPGQVGFALGRREATFEVSATGAVTSMINGCAITGTVAPRTDINAYDLTISFGDAPCAMPFTSFSGVAHLRADGKLVAAVRNGTLGQGIVFGGQRS